MRLFFDATPDDRITVSGTVTLCQEEAFAGGCENPQHTSNKIG
jgi:hypothetical protein